MQLKSFISRPVLSSVISIVIIVVGIISLLGLPMEQYPDIAPPTVSVSTSYYGASASTVQKSVIAPLEEAINGVENMMYMVSTATNNGNADIMIYFKQGTDPDQAAVNVQNRIAKATPMLPAEVRQNGIQTMKQQNSILQIFAISSTDDQYDCQFLANYLSINLKPKIMRIPGIGKFEMFGAEYSMRIWMKPDIMAAYHVNPSDITAALAEQNIEAATGTFGDNSKETTQYTMVFRGRLQSVEQFENIIIRSTSNGEILWLKDVADVELGTEHYAFSCSVNGHPGALCMLYQTAGSNATEVNNAVAECLEQSKGQLPPGIEINSLMNTNDFLYASIDNVLETLYEAILLVILIVLLFLHDFRSTIIPFVGIIVSLIGTFAFMQVAGFSINLISLFALVLVIGTVVDDSIVVVEAVHEKLDAGYKSPMKAAIDAMSEITTAVITSSLVFMAVFIPVSMMGGTNGVFFRQFGLTMAVAVGISALNALTLSPALCAILIKPKKNAPEGTKKGWYKRFSDGFDVAFEKWSEKYKNGIKPLIKHRWIGFAIVVLTVVLMAWIMSSTPKGFVPQEDKCMVLCDVILPPSTSLAITEKTMNQISDEIMGFDDVECTSNINGYAFSAGQMSSAGTFVLKMTDWGKRDSKSLMALAAKLATLNDKYPDATIIPFVLPMIPGYGTTADAEINLQDKNGGDMTEFLTYTQQFVDALSQRPEVSAAYTSFSLDNPQWLVDINIPKCHNAGLTANDVLGTLSAYCGGTYAGDFNLYGKIYKVMVQGTPESHKDEFSLNQMAIALPDGGSAPLSNFLTLKKIYGSSTLKRFNMLNSILVNASPAAGASTGDVLRATQEVADEILPSDYTFEFGGMAREESNGGNMGLMFAISALLIYLILSALYESYIVPFSIMLTVPAGVMGAYMFTWIFGLDNNIYLQTGVVMLIGLLSKTGILIVEFALQKRKEGLSIHDAALESAKARLRPIMMTAGTMVIGLLPLLVSTGAGAMGNISLAVGAVFGMIIGCIGLLFLTPALFVVFESLQEKIKPIENIEEE
mgnify:CR=1 FL=1